MPEPEPSPQPTSDSLQREFERLRDAVDDYPALEPIVERIPDETPEPETPDSPADLDGPESRVAVSHTHYRTAGHVHAAEPAVCQHMEFHDYVGEPGTGEWADPSRVGSKLAPRPMRLEQKKQALQARQEIFQNQAVELNAQLKQGRIESDEWLRRMMEEIKDLHTTAFAIGYSGRWDEIPNRDWGAVGPTVKRQYRFLRRWRREIQKKELDDLSLAKLNDRAQKYGQASSESFEKGYSAEVGMPPNVLPAYPGDGSTACLTRCKCRWAINILSKENQDFDCTWTLGVAEHCETCLERASEWVQLEVRNGVLASDPEPIFAR